jgi:hypothetical protein
MSWMVLLGVCIAVAAGAPYRSLASSELGQAKNSTN